MRTKFLSRVGSATSQFVLRIGFLLLLLHRNNLSESFRYASFQFDPLSSLRRYQKEEHQRKVQIERRLFFSSANREVLLATRRVGAHARACVCARARERRETLETDRQRERPTETDTHTERKRQREEMFW